jgi:2-dehydropantoate 2-reductase
MAKILVMGTGAVGGFFGARLARAGHEVVFVARGDNLVALRERGLRIQSFEGDFEIRLVNVVEEPAGAPRCDVVLVGVKSYDTEAAAAALAPVVDAGTIVVSLQNGIENEEILRRALGLESVLGGLTHIGAELVAPGVVRHDSGGRLVFGELDGAISPRARRLAEILEVAGVSFHLSRHIDVMLWDKLAWNSAFNAATAITRRTVGQLLAHADGRPLVRAAMLEVVEVARGSGVDLDPKRVDAEIDRSARELGHLRTSMLQDVERGRRIEIEALNGAVIRAAERVGVAVPTQRVLYAALKPLGRPPDSDPLSRTPAGEG